MCLVRPYQSLILVAFNYTIPETCLFHKKLFLQLVKKEITKIISVTFLYKTPLYVKKNSHK